MISLGGYERAVKRLLRPIIPAAVRHRYLGWRARRPRYNQGTPEQVFTAIYRDGMWGSTGDFYSGSGSHDTAITDPYVAALQSFIASLPARPDAVDLGCGDFAVGARIRPLCAGYIACDVVAPLIERNRTRFADLQVDFRTVDLAADALPHGDLALIRQVLQHLSNDQIAVVVEKLTAFRFLIVTEHVPANDSFTPNVDKAAGVSTRLSASSGVVLHAPPFNLKAKERRVLVEVADRGSIIQTTLWIEPHL